MNVASYCWIGWTNANSQSPSNEPRAGSRSTDINAVLSARRYSSSLLMPCTVIVRDQENAACVSASRPSADRFHLGVPNTRSAESQRHAISAFARMARPVDDSPCRIAIEQKFLSRGSDHPGRIVNKDLRWGPPSSSGCGEYNQNARLQPARSSLLGRTARSMATSFRVAPERSN